METVTCNFCGESENKPLFTLPDYLLERPNVVATLVQCSNCGLIYQNPRPTIDEIGEHYPAEYGEHISVQKKNPLLQWSASYGMRKRARFVARHKPGGRVLDIGCATGVFLDTLHSMGKWDAYGIEPSPFAVEIAQKNPKLSVQHGALEDTHFPDSFFDAVTMWDVLEHVHDPMATLREVVRILKPDGLLIFRVPNYASSHRKWFGKYWAGYEPPRHLYVFSPKTLTRLLQAANLTVIHRTTKSSNYLTFVLSIRFALTGNRVKTSTRHRILRLLNHPVSRLVAAPFFFAAGLFERGPLLVVTARRNK